MTSENGNSSDELPPRATYLQQSDTYDDILGVRIPIEDRDLSMPDVEEEHSHRLHPPSIANTITQRVQDPDKTAGRQDLMMELRIHNASPADTDPNSVNSGGPASHDTTTKKVPASRLKEEKIFQIKKEALDVRLISGMTMNTIDDPFEISDTEDADTMYKHGTRMSDGVIVLSDEEDCEEIMVFDDGLTSVAIKKENPDVEVSNSENDERSTAPAPKPNKPILRISQPRAKRTPAEIERMQQIQRLYAETALRRNLGPGAGRALANPQAVQSSEQHSPPHSSSDQFAWMNGVVLDDGGSKTDFRELRKMYKAKRKAHKNILEDDIAFKKAQNEENQRLKRLAQETADTDSDDEAEESDDGLFIPQEPFSNSKRPFSTMMDSIDDDDDDEELVPVEKPLSKKTRLAPPDLSTKRSRAKALQKELRSNMLAGIEASLLRDQKRIEDKAAKAAEAEAVHNGGKKVSKKARKPKTPDLSAKRTKTGRMNNLGSLMTSNLYEDSNANLDRQALPVITEKKKKEFMSSLTANIPLEDKKQANSDRIDILKASTILASRKVFPDGQGNWTFKGMKSSLYHYQITGAAYMKMRETGEQHPYGGILADEMGLGKTVQMIATMLANRQTDPEEPKCTLIVCSPALMSQCEFYRRTYAADEA